jgi:bacillithiol system protein YtxJ
MSWFKSSNFDWINLINQSSLDELINTSFENKVLLFKHSTRCSISSLA